MAKTIKKAQAGSKVGGTKSRTVYRNPEKTYKTVVKEKSGPRGEMKSVMETRTLKGVLKGVPKSSGVIDRMRGTYQPKANFDIPKTQDELKLKMDRLKARNGKQMIKRADGSVSQRGLWDNIRAAAKRNKAAGKPGKKPTAAMLKQERKIKAKGK